MASWWLLVTAEALLKKPVDKLGGFVVLLLVICPVAEKVGLEKRGKSPARRGQILFGVTGFSFTLFSLIEHKTYTSPPKYCYFWRNNEYVKGVR